MLWEDLFLGYGQEFLDSTNTGDPLYSMDSLESVLAQEVKKYGAVRVFALGNYSYGYFGGDFDFRSDYFLIDTAGNYASLGEGHLLEYLIEQIDEREFLDWLYDNKYITADSYLDLSNDI